MSCLGAVNGRNLCALKFIFIELTCGEKTVFISRPRLFVYPRLRNHAFPHRENLDQNLNLSGYNRGGRHSVAAERGSALPAPR